MINRSKKGTRWEYKVRDTFEDLGYFVIKSSRSKLPDLTAIKKTIFGGKIFIIECKWNKYITKKEREDLLKISKKTGAVPIVAYPEKEGRKVVPHFYVVKPK